MVKNNNRFILAGFFYRLVGGLLFLPKTIRDCVLSLDFHFHRCFISFQLSGKNKTTPVLLCAGCGCVIPFHRQFYKDGTIHPLCNFNGKYSSFNTVNHHLPEWKLALLPLAGLPFTGFYLAGCHPFQTNRVDVSEHEKRSRFLDG